MDQELKYNASRYYDETAYKALNAVQKGEKMGNRIGEIWEVAFNNGRYSECLVIADGGNVVTMIRLCDECSDNTDITINCFGRKYAYSRMLQYTFTQHLTRYIRTVTEDELNDVMQKVAGSLGIESQVIERVVEVPNELAVKPIEEPSADVYSAELERTKAQLEVYKNLYDGLMMKLMDRGA